MTCSTNLCATQILQRQHKIFHLWSPNTCGNARSLHGLICDTAGDMMQCVIYLLSNCCDTATDVLGVCA
jgi:hypothetical protein